jgi:hypothetical protein
MSSRLRDAAAGAARAALVSVRASVVALAATAGAGCLFDDGSYHEGDVVITSGDDVEDLAPVEIITGDLIIHRTSLRTIEIPLLQAVHGDVIVADNAALTTLRIRDLGYVGNLTIQDNPALTELSIAEIRSPGAGRMVVAGNDALASLSLRARDLDAIEITDNAALGPLGIEARTTRSITVAHSPLVTQLGMSVHDGALTVTDMAGLQTLAMGSRHSAALTLERCAALMYVTLLNKESFGDLRVHDNGALRDLSMPALTSVTGRFEVTQNPQLRRCTVERLLAQLAVPPAGIELAGNDETVCVP